MGHHTWHLSLSEYQGQVHLYVLHPDYFKANHMHDLDIDC